MTMSGGEERSGDEDEDEAEVGIDNDDEVETALAGAMAVDHNYSLISLHLPRSQDCTAKLQHPATGDDISTLLLIPDVETPNYMKLLHVNFN